MKIPTLKDIEPMNICYISQDELYDNPNKLVKREEDILELRGDLGASPEKIEGYKIPVMKNSDGLYNVDIWNKRYLMELGDKFVDANLKLKKDV